MKTIVLITILLLTPHVTHAQHNRHHDTRPMKRHDTSTYERIMRWNDSFEHDGMWWNERIRYIERRAVPGDDLQPTYYASPWRKPRYRG